MIEALAYWLPYIIPPLITAILGAFLGYLIGLKTQRVQILQQYVSDTVKERYPVIYSEIQRNTEILDNFLQNPDVSFHFSGLLDLFAKGLDALMKKYHKDLHSLIQAFKENELPKFEKLISDKYEIKKGISSIWSDHLLKDDCEIKKKGWNDFEDEQTNQCRTKEQVGRKFYNSAVFMMFGGLFFSIVPYNLFIAFVVSGLGVSLEIWQMLKRM